MPWTKMHLYTWVPSFVIMVVITLFLAKWLKRKDYHLKMLPIRIVAVVLVIMEIIKQVISIKRGYDLFHLPLHFCSMFVFLLPLFAFYSGKYKNHVKLVTIVSSMMLLMFMTIAPNVIYNDSYIVEFFVDFFSFHTVVFHNLVIFALLYTLFVEDFNFDTKKDCRLLTLCFVIYSIVACGASYILKTNYNSFYACQIPAIDDFRLLMVDKIGWVAQLVYVIGMGFATLLFGIMCYWVLRGVVRVVERLKDKNNTRNQTDVSESDDT